MLVAKNLIVLPAHNEEQAITKVVTDCLNYTDAQIVVAASGCTDKTVDKVMDIACQTYRVTCWLTPIGKGRAVSQVFSHISALKVVMLDSDGTYPVKSITSFFDALENVPVVMGCRTIRFDNMPAGNSWGNKFITSQAAKLFKYPLTDLCTGMWGFRGDVVKMLDIQSSGFTLEAEIFTKLAKRGIEIEQVPIEYYPRIGKRKINRMDHLKILAYLYRQRFSR
jgi:dolichol-phosphate mannosyltransferase